MDRHHQYQFHLYQNFGWCQLVEKDDGRPLIFLKEMGRLSFEYSEQFMEAQYNNNWSLWITYYFCYDYFENKSITSTNFSVYEIHKMGENVSFECPE